MGYSVASGELKQIGATATTSGIVEASTMEIGDRTLHDVSYNEQISGRINPGERIALLLTPTNYVAAWRRQGGEIEYSSEENRALLEEPISYPYYIAMGLLGLVTTFAGIGLIILLKLIKSYTKHKDIERTMAEFRGLAI